MDKSIGPKSGVPEDVNAAMFGFRKGDDVGGGG